MTEPTQVQGESLESRIEKASTPDPSATPDTIPTAPAPAEENQPAPAPSAEQTNTEPSEEAQALESSKNPERTKAYIDKLKAERDELRSRVTPPGHYGTSVFDQPKQEVPVAPQGQPDFMQQVLNTQQFVDAEGNVDVVGLNQAIQQSNDRALLAQQEAAQARDAWVKFEQTQQAKEAHAAHPQLDPTKKETFDPRFFELVKDRMIRNHYERKSQSLLDVANEIASVYTPPQALAKAKEETAQQLAKATVKRQQGPIEPGHGQTRETVSDYQDLRNRTMQGDDAAFQARLKALGI